MALTTLSNPGSAPPEGKGPPGWLIGLIVGGAGIAGFVFLIGRHLNA